MRKSIFLIFFMLILSCVAVSAGWDLDWLSPVGVIDVEYYPSSTTSINFSFNYTATGITLNPGNSANCSILNSSSRTGSYSVLYSTNLTNDTFFNYTATLAEGRYFYYSSCEANSIYYNSSVRIMDVDVDYYKLCLGENCAVNISMDNGQIETKGGVIAANYSGDMIGYYTEEETNDTIDIKLAGNVYNASINYTKYGTPSSVPANYINYSWAYDGNSYNITIATGANALEHYMNFTGVSDINRLCMRTRFKTSIATSSIIQVDIWDITLNGWEAYGDLAPTSDFEVDCFEVFDPIDHIVDNVIPMRYIMVGNGLPNQKFMIDFIWVLDGYTPLAATEGDPHSIHTDGTTSPLASIDWNDKSIYNVSSVNMTGGAKIRTNDTCLILISPDGTGVVNVCNT